MKKYLIVVSLSLLLTSCWNNDSTDDTVVPTKSSTGIVRTTNSSTGTVSDSSTGSIEATGVIVPVEKIALPDTIKTYLQSKNVTEIQYKDNKYSAPDINVQSLVRSQSGSGKQVAQISTGILVQFDKSLNVTNYIDFRRQIDIINYNTLSEIIERSIAGKPLNDLASEISACGIVVKNEGAWNKFIVLHNINAIIASLENNEDKKKNYLLAIKSKISELQQEINEQGKQYVGKPVLNFIK